MGWRKATMLAVLLAIGTGCPEEWRKGGVMDRAVSKDVEEGLDQEQTCANGLPAEWHCTGQDPNRKCRWKCPG